MFINFSNEFDTSNVIRTINIVISSLSLICSINIIFLFWFFKEIRNFMLELIIWLSAVNIVYNISSFFPYSSDKDSNKFWCGAQSFLILTAQNSSNIWTCIIGYSAFISIFRKEHLSRHRFRYRTLFIFLSTLLPILLASM